MTYRLTLQEISPVTHDTWHLVFDRPDGFDFAPGQATHWALDRDGWRDEDRPFTMTSLPSVTDRVEFVIKSYPDHDGVTEQIPGMTPGDGILAEEPAGAITDHGPGLFLAAGAGVTPFIPILKKQTEEGMTGRHLIFANKTEKDIILKDTWDAMPGLRTDHVLSDDPDTRHHSGKLDRALLEQLVETTDQPCYICGPKGFVNDIRAALKAIGVPEDRIVTENGW